MFEALRSLRSCHGLEAEEEANHDDPAQLLVDCLFPDVAHLAQLLQAARDCGPPSPFETPSALDTLSDDELTHAWQTGDYLACDEDATMRYLQSALLRRLLDASTAERAHWRQARFRGQQLLCELEGALRREVAALGAASTPLPGPFTLFSAAWVPALSDCSPAEVARLWDCALFLGCDERTRDRVAADLLQRRMCAGDAAAADWVDVLASAPGLEAALDAAQERVLVAMNRKVRDAVQLFSTLQPGSLREVAFDETGRVDRAALPAAIWGGEPSPYATFFGHGMGLVHAATEAEQCDTVTCMAAAGDLQHMRTLLETQGYVWGASACLAAALYGHLPVLQYLADRGADVNGATIWITRSSPLHAAVARGHVGCVRLLANLGADIEAADRFGMRPLHYAANGHVEFVHLLVNLGANIEAADVSGARPLHDAARYGHVDCVRALVELGGDVKAADQGGTRPLSTAAMGGHVDCLRALVELGADIEAEDDVVGMRPLHWAAKFGHVDCVRALAELGADINAAGGTFSGERPLHSTMWYGHVECVRVLVELGAAVEAADDGGRRPLHAAAQRGHVECVRALVELGAAVEAADDDGRRAVHLAAGHAECVRALVELGGSGSGSGDAAAGAAQPPAEG